MYLIVDAFLFTYMQNIFIEQHKQQTSLNTMEYKIMETNSTD
jgi:hypothetical protein